MGNRISARVDNGLCVDFGSINGRLGIDDVATKIGMFLLGAELIDNEQRGRHVGGVFQKNMMQSNKYGASKKKKNTFASKEVGFPTQAQGQTK